jgi:hypothetical protein
MDETTHTGIEIEFDHMTMLSSDVDLAINFSHLSPIFLDESLPPLCACDSDPCECPVVEAQSTQIANGVEMSTHACSLSENSDHIAHPCTCSCHEAHIMFFPISYIAEVTDPQSDNADDMLTHTHIVILSIIAELEHSTPYSTLPSEVHAHVTGITKVTAVEYK